MVAYSPNISHRLQSRRRNPKLPDARKPLDFQGFPVFTYISSGVVLLKGKAIDIASVSAIRHQRIGSTLQKKIYIARGTAFRHSLLQRIQGLIRAYETLFDGLG